MVDLYSDEEIMIKVKNNQLALMKPLFDRYHVKLYNFFLRLTYNEDVSKDLVQNVFYRIIKYRKTYNPEYKFKSWIYQLARNNFADDATKAMVINSLEGQSSPSQRIAGVNASFKLKEADDEIITVLINTMKNDNNINVRLAAIEALYQFSSEERVKDAFVHALARQKEPVIQLTLINILVNLKENRAIDHMQKIIEDKQTIKSVKDEAQLGVYKLS